MHLQNGGWKILLDHMCSSKTLYSISLECQCKFEYSSFRKGALLLNSSCSLFLLGTRPYNFYGAWILGMKVLGHPSANPCSL